MNKILTLITVISLPLLLTGCRTLKEKETLSIITKDSIVYNINYKDTTIYIPKEEAIIDGVKVIVDTAGKAQLAPVKITDGRATVEATIKDGKLVAKAICAEDSLKLVIAEKEKQIFHLREEKNNKVQVKEVKHVPDIYKYLSAMGLISLIYLLYKVIKKFIP